MALDGRGLAIDTGARAGASLARSRTAAPAQLTPPRPPLFDAGRGGTPAPDSRKRAAEGGAAGAAAAVAVRREASPGLYRPPGRVPSPGATARAIESLQRWRSETPSSEGSPRSASGSPRAATARAPFAAAPRSAHRPCAVGSAVCCCAIAMVAPALCADS